MAMRVNIGGLEWVWDNRASGTCQHCDQPIASGQIAYRLPRRPWKSRKDPIIHEGCVKEHNAQVGPMMEKLRRMREGNL